MAPPAFLLLESPLAASLHYLPQMSAFNSHMQQNTYCRNLSEPLLPCYCYAIKANFKTILPSDRTGVGFLAGAGYKDLPQPGPDRGRGKFCMHVLTLRQHFRCFAHGVDNEQVCVVFHP